MKLYIILLLCLITISVSCAEQDLAQRFCKWKGSYKVRELVFQADTPNDDKSNYYINITTHPAEGYRIKESDVNLISLDQDYQLVESIDNYQIDQNSYNFMGNQTNTSTLSFQRTKFDVCIFNTSKTTGEYNLLGCQQVNLDEYNGNHNGLNVSATIAGGNLHLALDYIHNVNTACIPQYVTSISAKRIRVYQKKSNYVDFQTLRVYMENGGMSAQFKANQFWSKGYSYRNLELGTGSTLTRSDNLIVDVSNGKSGAAEGLVKFSMDELLYYCGTSTEFSRGAFLIEFEIKCSHGYLMKFIGLLLLGLSMLLI